MSGHSAAYFSCLLWKLSMEDPSPIFSSKYKAISKPIVLYPSKYFYSFRFFTEGSVHKNVNNDVNFVLNIYFFYCFLINELVIIQRALGPIK